MIDKRKMDKLGVSTSLLGFGAMRLPVIDGKQGEVDLEKAGEMFDVAIANGVNYFDTAVFYHDGKSEEVMGKLLKKHPRESLYYATKLPVSYVKEESDVYKVFESQLENLQTDYIDFYLLHGIGGNDIEPIKKFKILEKLEQLKNDGKIRHIGFSFHDSLEAFKKVIEIHNWDFCMIQLSYVDINHQQGIEGYNIIAEKGIPAIIMEPVRGGSLAKFNDEISELFKPFNKDNASLASFALRWLANLPNVKVILSGMSNMEQIMDNVNTLTNPKPMNDDELEMLKQVKYMTENTKAISCTRCNYCIPCPVDVNIPDVFGAYNEYYVYKNSGKFKWLISETENNKKGASLCTSCGVCVSKCPQKIDIPKMLKEVSETEKATEW